MSANFEIIGYAERAVAIPEDVPTSQERDYSSRRWGNEAYISGQLFSVRLSAQGALFHLCKGSGGECYRLQVAA